MRFDRLRLTGFKSFVEPAELHIRDGLTGVVGPNGCGKSNLLEAIRWVMGESSARSLRVAAGGSGMDDVIFAGTAKRPSRNLAEVKLVLDNSRRTAPPAFNADDRLEVTRAIARGEGSSYSVNGRDVRLKDVQLLFADAATGAHSPALVSQGRVAAIIAARPTERRQLLEEAAGISGLAVRRREAEQRLKAADANLLRLDDVMRSAESQANGLRRQAKAAERYRTLSAGIRELESGLMRLGWDRAIRQLAARESAQSQAEAMLQEAVGAAARAAAAQASASADLPGLRTAEAFASAGAQRLQTERATLLAEREAISRRLRDLDAAIVNATTDRAREQDRARDAAATRARLVEERSGAEAARQAAQAATAPLAAAVSQAEKDATAAERALAAAVEAHAAMVADARSVRATAEAARNRAERIEGETARLMRERDKAAEGQGVATLATDLASAEAGMQAHAAQAEAAQQAIAEAERLAAAARAAAEAVERALSAARSEVASLEAEAAALDRLKAGAAATARRRVPLSATPGHEAALAAALGDDVFAAIGAGDGAIRRWLGVAPGAGDPPLPDGVRPLLAQTTAPPALARRLAQVGIVETPPDAAVLAALAPGQRLVSLNGWLWRWDGFAAPPGGAAVAVAESLAQDNRRREIAQALADPRARRDSAEAELAAQKASLASAQEAERRARTDRATAERARDGLAARLSGLRAAEAQAAARLQALVASIERLCAEGAAARAEALAAQTAVTQLPDASVAAEAVAAARSRAERSRSTLAEARAQAAATERALAESQARITRLERELADWERRDRDAQSATAALDQRITALYADRSAMVAEPAARDARLHLLEADIATAEAARSAAGEAVLAAEMQLADLDRAARAADLAVADRREARATAASLAAQARDKVEALAAEAMERFGTAPGTIAAPPGVELEALEARLQAMSAERERLGVVNLRADIELAEMEAVLATQTREKAELETAIARLRGSIGSLNREGRARLLAAFAAVDRHFRELFVTLFGGGAAELSLIESDDPLEAGLEIRAQPPGKKLQSLSLLSGGEQALTAIALIFGLFLTNPAPICVLDEVDAPLDDANVERFTRLLEHMAGATDTRFLIVTHNAVTMAAMHRLYGVTMAEPGVSQLVSVDLAEAGRIMEQS